MRRLPRLPDAQTVDERRLTLSEARMMACATMPLDMLRRQVAAEVQVAYEWVRAARQPLPTR